MPIVETRKHRTRVEQYYERLDRRWGTILADTMRKPDQLALGMASTGQDWMEVGQPAVAPIWQIVGGIARLVPTVPAGTQTFAYVGSPLADVRLRARMRWNGTAGIGSGLCYRMNNLTVSGFLLTYIGAGAYGANTYVIYDYQGGPFVGLATLSGPSWNVGDRDYLEVRVAGQNHTFYARGTQIGTLASALYTTQRNHGLYQYANGGAELTNEYDNVRVTRHR